MTQRGRSSSPSWWKIVAAYVVAVPGITIAVITLHWAPAVGLLGAVAGVLIVYRWQP